MPEAIVATTGEGQQQGAQTQGAPTGEGEGQQQGAQTQGQQTHEPFVPYERLQAVTRQNQEFRSQLQQIQEQLTLLQTPAKTIEDMQRKKRETEEFYRDPVAYNDRKQKELHENFQRMQAQAGEIAQQNVMLEQLRSSPGFSQEVENAMAKAITEFGLLGAGRVAAIKVSYKIATGKDWGSWTVDGYNTRLTKERLMRSQSGSGSGQQGAMMSPEDFKNVSLEEFEKNPQKYIAMLDAYEAMGA